MNKMQTVWMVLITVLAIASMVMSIAFEVTSDDGTPGATKSIDDLDAGTLGVTNVKTSLVSDTANTDDLGADVNYWKKLYLASDIQFEGATDNAFTQTIIVDDPTTPSKTVHFSDASGTVAVSATAPATLSALGDVGVTVAKDIVPGVGISGGENDVLPGAEADVTITFDATQLDAITWSDAANASNAWNFDLSGTDPVLTAVSAGFQINDNLQVGHAGTDGTLKLYAEDGGTDHSTTLQPGTQTQDVTLTLPVDDGTTGQFLQSDGSGVLAWATPAGTGNVVGGGTTVDNTVARYDSTTGNLLQPSSVTIQDTAAAIIGYQSLADDATYALPNATSGIGYLMVGDNAEWAMFSWSTGAVVNLMIYSANVTATGTTDNKFNIYDAGTAVTLENKLGVTVTVKLMLNY